MASILYLRLDAANDPVFIPGAALADVAAVEQAILTRLRLFEGEWWENLEEGTPMFQNIIGASGSPRSTALIETLLTERVSGTPYVASVDGVSVVYDRKTRSATYRATAQTAFGPVPVSLGPGTLASL
jgi:pantothenate kinase-related protein Tda10